MTCITRLITAIAVGATVLSCGGGGGGGSGADTTPPVFQPPPAGGIEGTGIAIGPVDGFGSIFVNGIEFSTSNTTFEIDDNPGLESQLQVGQLVTVIGSISDDGLSGVADLVFYDSDVEGPVDNIDTALNQLTVLGQTINITAQTVFGDIPGGSLDGLNVGDEVRISGFAAADGSVTATRIDPDTPDGEFEVRGQVSSLDSVNFRFMINALMVDYSTAMLEGFTAGMPADGDFVEVRGTVQMDALVATEVSLEDDLPDLDEGDEVEIEGLVTRFATATDFDVAGYGVTTTAGTTFENGMASQLALNVLVEVEGIANASGVLVADKVEFGDDGSIRMDGIVEAVDAQAGQLTVFTIPITVTTQTRIEDKSDADVRPFSLADINPGDYVEVRGLLDPSGNAIASRLERDDPESDVSLRGPVSSVSEPDFVILGVTVSTSAQTSYINTTSADFFANANGRIVEVSGSWDGSRITAQTVSFED
ncbi:MAG: hypothetical protein HKM98_01245 [Gammaproteobacteria bacterium]|nr:hypothetical protein [Gammaproteobacteria bacterium]